MDMNPSFESQVIGDITALKIVVQTLLGAHVVAWGVDRNAHLEEIRQGCMLFIANHQIIAPGLNQADITSRIEATINSIFDNLRIS